MTVAYAWWWWVIGGVGLVFGIGSAVLVIGGLLFDVLPNWWRTGRYSPAARRGEARAHAAAMTEARAHWERTRESEGDR